MSLTIQGIANLINDMERTFKKLDKTLVTLTIRPDIYADWLKACWEKYPKQQVIKTIVTNDGHYISVREGNPDQEKEFIYEVA